MLHREFAIHPEQIRDIRDLRLLEARFGYDKGSLISAFPRGWLRVVAECLARSTSETQPDRVTDLLKQLKDAAVCRFAREYQGDPWVDSARASHDENAFHRIVEASLNNPPVLVRDLEALGGEDFSIPHQVARDAKSIAWAAKALLTKAQKVTVLDPFVCPTKAGSRQSLLEMMELCTKDLVKFVIFSEDDNHTPDWTANLEPALQAFQHELPPHIDLHWYWLSDNDTGYIHPRAVFTGKGGISYDRGVSEPSATGQREMLADVHILSKEQWQQKGSDFNESQLPEFLKITHFWQSNNG